MDFTYVILAAGKLKKNTNRREKYFNTASPSSNKWSFSEEKFPQKQGCCHSLVKCFKKVKKRSIFKDNIRMCVKINSTKDIGTIFVACYTINKKHFQRKKIEVLL